MYSLFTMYHVTANDYRKPEWRMKQQHREYADPHKEMLHIIVTETNSMLWPAETIVQATLDYLYKASSTAPLSTSQIGAIAQWYSALPRETFLFPLVLAIVSAVLAVDTQPEDNIRQQVRLIY
jgi:hypothetical protein